MTTTINTEPPARSLEYGHGAAGVFAFRQPLLVILGVYALWRFSVTASWLLYFYAFTSNFSELFQAAAQFDGRRFIYAPLELIGLSILLLAVSWSKLRSRMSVAMIGWVLCLSASVISVHEEITQNLKSFGGLNYRTWTGYLMVATPALQAAVVPTGIIAVLWRWRRDCSR